MSKIKILADQLANQIAAGEVVERPASVVKELVENSLDAGATRIEIEIEGSGTRLIRVIDDGEGMEEDDLLMSLERHGTSKITTEKDLGSIATLGFRGEALPSIGSVSKLTLTSRVRSNDLGTRVVLEYGKLTKVHEIGHGFGTTVEVRNLFGNTPARRKFLRTSRTELGHIEEIIKNYGLGCPDITFILKLNGRNTLYLDDTMDVQQRLGVLMRYENTFIPVEAKQKSPKRHLTGLLLPPECVTAGPAKLRIFVNGRAVRDRMIAHGIGEGLRSFLMKGKNPAGMVHLHLSPDEIDVNVHPAKHEIRFRNSRDVHTFVSEAVSSAMSKHQRQLKQRIFSQNDQPEKSRVPLQDDQSLPRESEPYSPPIPTPIVSPVFKFESRIDSEKPLPQRVMEDNHSRKTKQSQRVDSHPPTSSPSPTPPPESSPSILNTAEPQEIKSYPLQQKTGIKPPEPTEQIRVRHNLLVIGQFDNLYIFCRNGEGLLVIDQHAAHERLLYEKLRKQYLEGRITRQTLMFPETLELSLFQAQLVEKNIEELDRMGFTVREFGGNTFVISAVPAIAGTTNIHELFLDVLEHFGSEDQHHEGAGFLEDILASMACKAAIKRGTSLSQPEVDKLLDDMMQADLFSHCPHGRPVVKQFSNDDIKKWFYRT